MTVLRTRPDRRVSRRNCRKNGWEWVNSGATTGANRALTYGRRRRNRLGSDRRDGLICHGWLQNRRRGVAHVSRFTTITYVSTSKRPSLLVSCLSVKLDRRLQGRLSVRIGVSLYQSCCPRVVNVLGYGSVFYTFDHLVHNKDGNKEPLARNHWRAKAILNLDI